MFDYSKRPTTETEISNIIRVVHSLTEKEDYGTAITICDWLIQNSLTQSTGLRERSYIKECMNDIDGAIDDLHELISDTYNEPCDAHNLGTLYLKQQKYKEAIQYFTKAIDLEINLGNSYYTNSSLLHRAYALCKNRRYDDAINDCSRLPSGYNTYFYGVGMISKEDIINGKP